MMSMAGSLEIGAGRHRSGQHVALRTPRRTGVTVEGSEGCRDPVSLRGRNPNEKAISFRHQASLSLAGPFSWWKEWQGHMKVSYTFAHRGCSRQVLSTVCLDEAC